MSSSAVPTTVQGGCLCEAIRYTITFPTDHDFASSVNTCQCEQCRKNTGSLLARFHNIPRTHIQITDGGQPSSLPSSSSSSSEVLSPPASAPAAALRSYNASPANGRGFCSTCGSFLFWYALAGSDICLAVGTLDKKFLTGGGEGPVLLTKANTHLWCEAEIPGVTDHLPGQRWKTDYEGDGAELME